MKKLLAAALSLILLTGCISIAYADKLDDILAQGKIIVGMEPGFAPFEFYYADPKTGETVLGGFDVKLAYGIAEKLGVECEIADQAFNGLITALRSGEIDMIISGMVIKPERSEVVDFSEPYYGGTQILLVLSKDLETYKTPADFSGKKIGAQLGSVQQEIAETQFATCGAEVMLLDKVALLVQELLLGNIDGLLLADIVAKNFMTLYPELAISAVPVEFDATGVGVAVQQGDNETLLAAINEYLSQVLSDGTFSAWEAEATELAELVAK